jgi:hypothetical protein
MRAISISLIVTTSLPLLACEEEQVDAYYYPNRYDLTVHEFFGDVGSFDGCIDAVFAAAAEKRDPNMLRGNYECAFGPTGEMFGGMKVYRETRK